MSAADKTKLDAIASGATANATDAQLRDRSTHTGTQAVGTITGLGVFATGTDAANLTGTVAAARLPAVVSGGASGAMSGTDKAKLDGIASSATANSTDATLLNRANHTGTQAVGTITGLAAVATSGSAADLSAGTLLAARMPAFTGDVTSSAGAVALTIGANKVTRAMLAAAAGATLLGATAAGNVADLTAAQAKTFLAIAEADVSNLTTDLAAKAPLASPQFTGRRLLSAARADREDDDRDARHSRPAHAHHHRDQHHSGFAHAADRDVDRCGHSLGGAGRQ
jgi:hypothetical protein